jgi:predicted metalloprotease with PDZ domain
MRTTGAGLQWRGIQDTTNDPIVVGRAARSYLNYQMSEDYYRGGQMIWLEADALIRAAERWPQIAG